MGLAEWPAGAVRLCQTDLTAQPMGFHGTKGGLLLMGWAGALLGLRSAGHRGRIRPAAAAPRLAAAAAWAAAFAAPSAVASEYTTFELLDVTSAGTPACQTVVPFNLPMTWQTGDGAVVLMAMTPLRDAMRETLMTALLAEGAAVLELVPVRCDERRAGHDSAVADALGALEAVTRTAGAGMVVAIGYGQGGMAVLDVVREPAAGRLGANGPRYAAAIAMGQGAFAFALGASLPIQEQAPARLAALCHALAAIAGGTGATPERATAAESCRSALSVETSRAASLPPVTSGQ